MKRIIPYIVILLLVAINIHTCRRLDRVEDTRDNTAQVLSDSIRYYKNAHGQEVAAKKALQGDKTTLEILLSNQIDSTQQLRKLVDSFRDIDAGGNIVTVTKIDTVFVPFLEEKIFQLSSEKYSIAGEVQDDGVLINSLVIPNTMSFAIGRKKTGWFSSEYRVEVVNSNPLIQTTGIDAYSISVPQKRWGIGLFTGIMVGSDFQPEIGIGLGLTYDLFSF